MNRTVALILVGLAGVMWASSGVAVQDFFAHSYKSAMDLTNIRMMMAGLFLLLIAWLHGGLKRSLRILRFKPRLWIDTAVYGIAGVALMQFTYFQAISIGGAAATTVIQYACPAFVVIFDSLYYRRLPTRGEVLAVILAMVGVFLLVTGGDIDKLLVPLACVLWSLASGAFFAFSAIFPKHLFESRVDQYFLTSVGMIIGGLFTFLLVDEINWLPFFQSDTIFDVMWIIIFGTVGAFLLFNMGLVYLTPEEASVTAAMEPVASVVLSFFIFGTMFGLIEIVGILMVILAIMTPIFIRS
ncbi:MAG: EamA family transporter [Selenomonadaceae bacterium]|nr:EamA family transporter [Selenomonadaceae bacterium]